MSHKFILIESPFAGAIEENLAYAQKCMRHVFFDDNYGQSVPIASHCFFTLALDDQDQHERRIGIEAGFAMRNVVSEVRVYVDRGLSSGMILGIRSALAAGKPVSIYAFEPDEVDEEVRQQLRILPIPDDYTPDGVNPKIFRATIRAYSPTVTSTEYYGGPMPERLEAAARAAGSKLKRG